VSTATAPSTALTIVERVEQSQAIALLDSRATGLLELLPDAAAVSRFRRIVIQALAKTPELLDCTPESVVLSVFEAATQGLEPTGASGGAHLVPFNVKVQKNPDRWERRAQLIPDYRGVVQLVTKPRIEPKTGRVIAPSEVLAIEARVVKEGDEFSWSEGSDAAVHHIPAMAPDRSAKATTHVYAIARFRSGGYSKPEVLDRTEVERIRKKGGRGEAFSPWATDWDEMARKTAVKRLAKLLPVPPEIRSILVREDELSGADPDVAGDEPAAPGGPTKASRLAARLVGSSGPAADDAAAATAPTPEPDIAEGQVREDPTWMQGGPAAEPAEPEQPQTEQAAPADPGDLVTLLRDTAAASGMKGAMTEPQRARLVELLGGLNGTGIVPAALTAIWGEEAAKTLTAARAQSVINVAETRGTDALVEAFRAIAERSEGT